MQQIKNNKISFATFLPKFFIIRNVNIFDSRCQSFTAQGGLVVHLADGCENHYWLRCAAQKRIALQCTRKPFKAINLTLYD